MDEMMAVVEKMPFEAVTGTHTHTNGTVGVMKYDLLGKPPPDQTTRQEKSRQLSTSRSILALSSATVKEDRRAPNETGKIFHWQFVSL